MTLIANRQQHFVPQAQREMLNSPDVVGVLFAEVILSGSQRVTPELTAPELSGWEVRLWPVARLGDATLEARPLYPHLDADHLRCDLRQAGIEVLGPVRQRR